MSERPIADLKAGLPEEPADAEEELAVNVISPERRRRDRRAVLVAGVLVAGALVLATVLAAVLGLFSSGAGTGAAADEPTPSSTWQEQLPGGLRWFEERAAIYAAAIGGPKGRPVQVYVRTHSCVPVLRRPPGQRCSAARIPDDVQRQLRALLGGRVRFVERLSMPAGPADPPVVVFGRLRITDNQARLTIETYCGRLCGEGRTLLLERVGGSWRVTGTTGVDWVS